MESFELLVAVFGLVVLLTAWLPMLMRAMPLSLPIVCIAIGWILVWADFAPILSFNPLESRYLTERLTEFVIVLALMGAGLKLDRPVGWRSWGVTWRLLGIAMPITIVGTTLVGYHWLELPLATALLLGAALAPTDPVLASDVQVGPPGGAPEDEVRFALTSEAGLNDGLAFPFVFLAIALAVSAGSSDVELAVDWLLVDVVWKLMAGLACGWAGGKAIGWLAFRLPPHTRLSSTGDGFVALGVASVVYGLTALAGGYGFLAVFVAGVALRGVERENRYHAEMHWFAEQVERLVMMVLLVCFGAAIAEGTVLSGLSPQVVVASLVIILVVRPVSGALGLLGAGGGRPQRMIISFFGIRGLGTFYYIAFALGQAEFEGSRTVWLTASCVVLISIVVHGITVTPVMRWCARTNGPC